MYCFTWLIVECLWWFKAIAGEVLESPSQSSWSSDHPNQTWPYEWGYMAKGWQKWTGRVEREVQRRDLSWDHFHWLQFCSLRYLPKIGSRADWGENDMNIKVDSIMKEVIKGYRSSFEAVEIVWPLANQIRNLSVSCPCRMMSKSTEQKWTRQRTPFSLGF